jgi:hypothetical protein
MGYEAAVHLQATHRKATDIGDRRMARAEIVEIDAAAHPGQRRDVADDHVVVGLRHHRFQHLDGQAVRRQVKAVKLPFQPFGEPGVAQFGG